MNNSVIRFPEVKSRCGISHSNIYNQINQGTFPKPIRLGERAVGWLSSEIDDWLSRKAEERLAVSRFARFGELVARSRRDWKRWGFRPFSNYGMQMRRLFGRGFPWCRSERYENYAESHASTWKKSFQTSSRSCRVVRSEHWFMT